MPTCASHKAIEDSGHRWQIQTNDALKTAAEYQPLIIHYNNGAAVRLSDVASVTDSVQDVRNAGMTNAKPAILLMIRKLPEANIIQTVNSIRARLPELQETIPAAIDLQIAQDRSPTIRASLEEVEQTLVISVGLVILVVFVSALRARNAHSRRGSAGLADWDICRHVSVRL
jgi:multidrug efflux pump